MSFFRRKGRNSTTSEAPVNSYEEAEQNPALIAAEEAVNELPFAKPAPTYSHVQIVTNPEDEADSSET